MKSFIAFAGLLLALASGAARADVTYDFVRVACVPEVGMLDVEYRGVHDTVAGDMHDGDMRRANALRQYGFYPARGLDMSCKLGQVVYRIKAEQGPEVENVMCGASPEVRLTVTRNGAPVLREVLLGINCESQPAVQRITFADGPGIMRDTEATVCYLSNDVGVDKTYCDWFWEKNGDFKKKFPIDQDKVRARVERVMKAQVQ
jgi:hypothetical protein